MDIESVRIVNFRGYSDQTVVFQDYTCMVGSNGAGKSTVLTALNVFFRQYKDSNTDLSKLSADDFHHKNVNDPIEITVTFKNLSDKAKEQLSDYVRQDKLIVSAIAKYDPVSERAEVKQIGNRLGMKVFRKYFEAVKSGARVTDLKEIFFGLKEKYPDIEDASTKAAMAAALQDFESHNPDECELIPSEDQFYGASKGTNRLAPHIQWVFVPAVKDITEESQESKTSGLGQLLQRTVRSKVNFSEKIEELRSELKEYYQNMLDAEQSVLDGLSGSIEMKLQDWAHPEVSAKVLWTQDSEKSVRVDDPTAYIKIGERGFESELARFGHGMQRSFMLSLLQELNEIGEDDTPVLILAIEEPELYQHPPQAKYLAEVLHDLAKSSSQVILCSHSPLFIPGDDFETVRVVRDEGNPCSAKVSQLSYDDLSKTLYAAGQKLLKAEGMLAKLYPALNPTLNEMFFCKILILVEGIEDVAHISSYISLMELLSSFRKYGCHIVPVGGKSEIIKPLAMAKQLGIPVFVVIDADTDEENDGNITKHKNDNKTILSLLGYDDKEHWPSNHIFHSDFVMWKTNITEVVDEELGDNWKDRLDAAAIEYGQAKGLKKNPLAISKALELAWAKEEESASLKKLSKKIIKFAKEAIESA